MKIPFISKQSEKITKETTVAEITRLYPLAGKLFAEYDIRFIGKEVSPLEPLEKVAQANNVSEENIKKLVNDLNKSIAEMETAKPDDNLLTLAPIARDKFKELLEQKKDKKAIRMRFVADGCAMNTYDVDFGTKPQKNETVFKTNGITFYINKKMITFIRGTKIDYLPSKGGFYFDNPNVKK